MNRLLLGFIFLVCVAPLQGQKYSYKKFTIYDGLPVNNVYCSVQDGDGFMWFGTDFGIVKFDGKNFKQFYTQHGMANKAVPCMTYAGGDSILFLSHPDVLQSIHTKTEKINTVKVQVSSPTTIQFKYSTLFFSKRFSPLYHVYKNGSAVESSISSSFNQKDLKQSCIIPLDDSKTLFCTNQGIYVKTPNSYHRYYADLNVTYGIQTKNKNFVFATNKGVFLVNEQLEPISSPIPLPADASIYYIAEDGDGAIWLSGLNKYIFRLSNGKLTEESTFLGLQNKQVNSMYLDRENNFWFCTKNDGILLKPELYKYYNDANGLVNNNIQSLFLQKNKLWIGTENGMSIFENDHLTTIHLNNNNKAQDYIYKITNFNEDTLGVALSAPHFLDGKKNKSIKVNQTNIQFFSTFNLWRQDKNTFWDTQKERITIHRNNATDEVLNLSAFNIKKIYCFYSYENNIWIGTDTGILIYATDKKFTFLNTLDHYKVGEVFDFLEDNQHTLWIATDVGVFTYHNNSFKAQPKGATFGSNYCKKLIFEDSAIWVATWDGLVRLKNNIRRVFSAGLTSKVINDVVYKPDTEEFYVGTDNGLSIIHKATLAEEISLPPIFIKAFYINQEQEIPFKNTDELDTRHNSLVFYLSTPYYKNIDDIRFEYKLDNNEWNTTDSKLYLGNQSQGQHKLTVRSNVSGDYSKAYTFTFTIKTPFYQTNWFIALMAILLQALVIYAIYRYNKKDKEKKIASLRQLNEQASLKQQAFTSLLNPHFIFNSLNSIQNFINKQDRTNANRYLSDFATLIRRNFDAAQKQFIPLENEIENLRLYLQLEHMRFGDKVTYAILLDDNVDADNWMLPTLILQPFVENALLHGIMPLRENGIIEIKFSVEKQKVLDKVVATENLIISISDNGIGIIKSANLNTNKKHKSRGMHLIKERLEILSKVTNTNIDLSVQNLSETNSEQPGTIVRIVYPEQVYDAYMKVNQSYHQKDI